MASGGIDPPQHALRLNVTYLCHHDKCCRRLCYAPPAAITLFEVFIHILEAHQAPETPWPSVWAVLPQILRDICK